MSVQRETTVADLQAQIDELREEGKQREPNLLGAIRTLIVDILAWHQGKRDFPRAAVIGFAFAYLRPRIILALGSLAAVIIAVAQILLLKNQNEIVGTQTQIMTEQSRLLRAQTVAAILPELGSPDSLTPGRSELLGAFGDVALDVVLPIVTSIRYLEPNDLDVVWLNAAHIVAINSRKLERPDAISALVGLHQGYARYEQAWSKVAHPNGSTSILVSEPRPLEISESAHSALSKDTELTAALQHSVRSLATFLYDRPLTQEDVATLTIEQRALVLAGVAHHYWRWLAVAPPLSWTADTHDPLDLPMCNICSQFGGIRITYDLDNKIENGVEMISQRQPSVELKDAVTALVMIWCRVVADPKQLGAKDIDRWNYWNQLASYARDP